jgi:hypothetical protein
MVVLLEAVVGNSYLQLRPVVTLLLRVVVDSSCLRVEEVTLRLRVVVAISLLLLRFGINTMSNEAVVSPTRVLQMYRVADPAVGTDEVQIANVVGFHMSL